MIAPILKDFSSLCHALPLLFFLSQNRPKDDRTFAFYYAGKKKPHLSAVEKGLDFAVELMPLFRIVGF